MEEPMATTGKWIINITHEDRKGTESHSIFYYNGNLTEWEIIKAWKEKFVGIQNKYRPISSTASFSKDPTVAVGHFTH